MEKGYLVIISGKITPKANVLLIKKGDLIKIILKDDRGDLYGLSGDMSDDHILLDDFGSSLPRKVYFEEIDTLTLLTDDSETAKKIFSQCIRPLQEELMQARDKLTDVRG